MYQELYGRRWQQWKNSRWDGQNVAAAAMSHSFVQLFWDLITDRLIEGGRLIGGRLMGVRL